MEIVSKETFEQIKEGVKLTGRLTKFTADQAVHTVKRKPQHKEIAKHARQMEWRCASKVAKTTVKVTATCAVALVGGLFAAIIAD